MGLITGDPDFWRNIFIVRYGTPVVFSLLGERIENFRSTSSWWKGIFLLEPKEDDSIEWFVDTIFRKVCSRIQTSFLKDIWLGHIFLKTKFSYLFLNFIQSNELVREIGLIVNEVLIWNLTWLRPFFLRELYVFEESLAINKWLWKHEREEKFSVVFAYLF